MGTPTRNWHGERYAEVAWRAEDVQTLKPDWSLERCEEVLSSVAKHLQDRTIEHGWEVLETLLYDTGWEHL